MEKQQKIKMRAIDNISRYPRRCIVSRHHSTFLSIEVKVVLSR